MAVDTKAKRMSMLAFANDGDLGFEVDGAVDADDRATLLALYGGIALDAPDDQTISLHVIQAYMRYNP